MIDGFEHAKNRGDEPLNPCAFIEQYANSTKRFIDDTVTVSLGSQSNGPKLKKLLNKTGTYMVECTWCMFKTLTEKKYKTLYLLSRNK